jgi:hypothetical protein
MEHLGSDQNSNHECVELQLGAIFSDQDETGSVRQDPGDQND